MLVNNAGVIRDNPLTALEDEEFRIVLETDTVGTFNMTRAVAPHMIAQRRGQDRQRQLGGRGKGGRGQTNYAASKGAINAFTRAVAVELAPRGITVNAVAPGVIETEMSRDVRERASDAVLLRILLRRIGQPADAAYAVGFWPHGMPITSRAKSCTWTADLKWNSMKNTHITKEEITAVYPKIAEIIAAALPCEIEKVKLDASLIDDLGAQSIDFLDIVFRLERGLKVKIPRGKIVEEARGNLSPAEFEQAGVVSPSRPRTVEVVPE